MSDTIESKTIEHERFTVTITVVPDSDSSPFDDECYTADEVDAWRQGEWLYVGYVYTASRAGVALGEASIWGSEWDFPGMDSSIDSWIAESYYHSKSVSRTHATLAVLTAE